MLTGSVRSVRKEKKRKKMFPQMKEDVEDETVAASDAVVMRTAGVLVVDM